MKNKNKEKNRQHVSSQSSHVQLVGNFKSIRHILVILE